MDKILVVTAGTNYTDIDAYACIIAMAELKQLSGVQSIAYSCAPNNYSVCEFLSAKCNGKVVDSFPCDIDENRLEYVIVDVSDPEYINRAVNLDNIVEVYDHHVGFENYWKERIGDKAHIEFLGAAATLIYREWKKSGLQDKITRSTAMLLIAAILDNTLNLTSQNTTLEDVAVFNELCKRFGVDDTWVSQYFSEVQKCVESDLKRAIFNDIKTITNTDILPEKIAQLTIWDAQTTLIKLPEIRKWFNEETNDWMINLIDIKHQCNYFVCDNPKYQDILKKVFNVNFENSVAKTDNSYLRKEIIKKMNLYGRNKI